MPADLAILVIGFVLDSARFDQLIYDVTKEILNELCDSQA